MKHLVTSGCSFTISDGGYPNGIGIRNRTWAWFLRDYLIEDGLNFELHNVGISGVGNYVISMNCIDIVENLLNTGNKAEDIYVIVQWSGLFRPCLYVENKNTDRPVPFNEMKTNNSSLKGLTDQMGTFVDTAGQITNNNPFWANYYTNYYSLPTAFTDTLDLILKTQWYLNSKNVQYKMFTGWDIFTTQQSSMERFGSDNMLNASQFSNQRYTNKDNILLKDVYPSTKHLWGKVDWSRFMFFNNKDVKFGGMLQWVQHIIDFRDWSVWPAECHPPSATADTFTKQALLPTIKTEIAKNDK